MVDSWLKKYLMMYIFVTKIESGGQFWRILVNRLLVALLLSNCCVGIVVWVSVLKQVLAFANCKTVSIQMGSGCMALASSIVHDCVQVLLQQALRCSDQLLHRSKQRGTCTTEARRRIKGSRQIGETFWAPSFEETSHEAHGSQERTALPCATWTWW